MGNNGVAMPEQARSAERPSEPQANGLTALLAQNLLALEKPIDHIRRALPTCAYSTSWRERGIQLPFFVEKQHFPSIDSNEPAFFLALIVRDTKPTIFFHSPREFCLP